MQYACLKSLLYEERTLCQYGIKRVVKSHGVEGLGGVAVILNSKTLAKQDLLSFTFLFPQF